MKNPITTLHIQNFKTIKDLKVNCKRINIIIGKPNVGKSNFLEALSLLGGTYSTNQDKFLSEFIRYNKFEDLFYDKEIGRKISVETNLGFVCINGGIREKLFDLFMGYSLKELDEFSSGSGSMREMAQKLTDKNASLNPKKSVFPYSFILSIPASGKTDKRLLEWRSPVKKYDFQKGIESTSRFHEFLMPPHGPNIFTILNGNKKLLKEVGSFFKEYKLKFGLRMADTSFEVIKQVGHYLYSTSYNLIADTLQRMIFNIAAIASNKESILLFEEPEAHSFPPYVKLFAEKVIESKTNQFFINTHSPFILNTIIEHTPLTEVAIFIASYEKYQTEFTELTEKQIREMLDYGNDIFFSPQILE